MSRRETRRLAPRPRRRGRANEQRDDEDRQPLHDVQYTRRQPVPGQRPVSRIRRVYGRNHAIKVVHAAMADCDAAFPGGDWA